MYGVFICLWIYMCAHFSVCAFVGVRNWLMRIYACTELSVCVFVMCAFVTEPFQYEKFRKIIKKEQLQKRVNYYFRLENFLQTHTFQTKLKSVSISWDMEEIYMHLYKHKYGSVYHKPMNFYREVKKLTRKLLLFFIGCCT